MSAVYSLAALWPLFALLLWYGLAAICTAVITYTDLTEFWIPDLPVVLLALGNGAAWYSGLANPHLLVTSAVALLFLLLYGCWPQSIGSGDIKLALALCPGCTAYGAYTMAVIAFAAAAVFALVRWLLCGQKLIPFGPFLLLGWWSAGLLQAAPLSL